MESSTLRPVPKESLFTKQRITVALLVVTAFICAITLFFFIVRQQGSATRREAFATHFGRTLAVTEQERASLGYDVLTTLEQMRAQVDEANGVIARERDKTLPRIPEDPIDKVGLELERLSALLKLGKEHRILLERFRVACRTAADAGFEVETRLVQCLEYGADLL